MVHSPSADVVAVDPQLCPLSVTRRAHLCAPARYLTPRCARLCVGCPECRDRGYACGPHYARGGPPRSIPDAPRAELPSPAAPSLVTPLTDHELYELARAVAPLGTLDEAAGMRALPTAPSAGGTSGASADTRALDQAVDTGALRIARRVWQIYARLLADERDTVRWLALHGAENPLRARKQFIASEAPREWIADEERTRARREGATALAHKLTRDARRGMSPGEAQAIDEAIKARDAAAGEHAESFARLDAWCEMRFRRAFDAWFEPT